MDGPRSRKRIRSHNDDANDRRCERLDGAGQSVWCEWRRKADGSRKGGRWRVVEMEIVDAW